LQEFRATWKDQSLTKSIKQGVLQTIMKFPVMLKWIPENPAMMLSRIKVHRAQQLPFTDEEMAQVLKAAKNDPKVYTFILTLRYSGLRIRDVAKPRVNSLRGNHFTLRTAKTGTPVKVLLPNVVGDALRTFKPESREYFSGMGDRRHDQIGTSGDTGDSILFSTPRRSTAHTTSVPSNLLKQGTPAGLVAILLGNTEKVVLLIRLSRPAQTFKAVLDSQVDDNGVRVFRCEWNNDFANLPSANPLEQRAPIISTAGLNVIVAGHRCALLFAALAGTGWRISEILSLTNSEYDRDAGILFIRSGKTASAVPEISKHKRRPGAREISIIRLCQTGIGLHRYSRSST
jgi:integrase